MNEKTAWGQDVEWPIVQTMFGQGSYGYECEVCKESDWGGPITHKPGCAEAAEAVRQVRLAAAQGATLAGAMNNLSDALNETGRLIRVEVERVAKQINDAWESRAKRN